MLFLFQMAISQSQMNPMMFFFNNLALLEQTEPRYVFATKDPFAIVIRNQNGTDIKGCLQKMPVFSFLGTFTLCEPGLLNRITYNGLTLYNNRDIQQDETDPAVKYGFDVDGQNIVIHPFENKEDYNLVMRITRVFAKYGHFALTNKHKSSRIKPLYDLTTYCQQKICGLQ